ncbi:MAG: LamG-like jellyroll fold domain-containing protein [Pirellulaceae bacterium]|nr:LamG-like jellyroll fold domain-containing protein [Pirellulaceae bacterium]
MNWCLTLGLGLMIGLGWVSDARADQPIEEQSPWRVGAASVEMRAEDSMVIGGGIGPGFTQGQEGKLQATATFIQGNGLQNEGAICIVAVDVLMMHRDTMDLAATRVSEACGLLLDRIMINASHTHHAPSTVTVHGYQRDEEFCLRTVDAIVEAAILAQRKARGATPSRGHFHRGREETVGQNSRQKLDDGHIYWIGPRDNVVGPTDPFDSDFPVLAFRSSENQLQAAWFNHSTHCIGTRTGRRSPSFYGLAAQELTEEHAMPVSFLSGAAGSTHNLTLDCDEMVRRIKGAFNESLAQAAPMKSTRLAGIRREVPFTIRMFDDQVEDKKVTDYCLKYATSHADPIINVFRESRRQLKPQQGQERTMWLQVLQIGDVYLVGVPAEYFTVLGLEIKRRSPFPNTFVCGLSNDYVGYLPDRKGFQNGGYQTWMGLHCFAEVGTGELVVEQCLEMLNELATDSSERQTLGGDTPQTPDRAEVEADAKNFRAGAAAIDITPNQLPRIIAGGFLEGRGDQVQDPLFVRTLVMDDGKTQLAMAIVDTCMMPQSLIDEAKQLVAAVCELPTEHIMISATHTHSAPAAMGCLGTRLDAEYAATLPKKIAESILLARSRLQPARIGWAAIDDWQHTHNRRWVRHPDRMIVDPFGQATGRAHMHPGHESPDIIGPSGPVDPELSILSVQTRDGTPLAVIANYGQHYFGAPAISADYFGIFAKYIADFLGQPGDGNGPFVCAMSQGTSGDLATMDYGGPAEPRDIHRYTEGVARFAEQALQSIEYRDHVELAVVEKRLPLRYRVPDRERLEWARPVAAQIENDVPKSLPEVYAREAIILHERQTTEIKLQAIRIGDLTIATLPNEVYSITGLKLKAQSPSREHFNIELANGAEGYIPPPEQHVLGGYTTWPARTAGLEIDAEPKIVETLVKALEEVTGQPRRPMNDEHGMYARAVLALNPTDYWRLNDVAGSAARNAIPERLPATLTPGFAWYLPGVGSGSGVGQERQLRTSTFSGPLQINRAIHLADGYIATAVKDLGDNFSMAMWFWLGERSGARQRSGTLVTLPDGSELVAEQFDDHRVELHYAGQRAKEVFSANHWNFATLVREGLETRIYVNGSPEPVIRLQADVQPAGIANKSPLQFGRQLLGKLDELAVWNQALTSDQIQQLWVLSEVPAEQAREAMERQRTLEQRRSQVDPPAFAPDYATKLQAMTPQLYSSLLHSSEAEIAKPEVSKFTPQGSVDLTEQVFADFRGGRLQAQDIHLHEQYSISVWFRSETRPETKPVAAYLLSVGPDQDPQASGEHLGIGGTHLPESTGKLLFFNGNQRNEVAVGRSIIPTATWNHVTVVRDANRVQVYLNGGSSPEIDTTIESTISGPQPLFVGSRSDFFAPLMGQMAHLAVFDRKLEADAVPTLFTAAGVKLPHMAVEQTSVSDGQVKIPEPDSQPRSPTDSLQSIRVPAGYRVELVAAEPEVLDPVAFDWDEHGRLWVVEMADYPSGMDGAGQPGGRIRRLEDRDGDGRFETSQLFAEGLNFPNGILTWDQGVLITAAPEILYLEDTNNDGQADLREVWFSGFNEGNQQLRVNGLRWGLDGWVYCANGGHHAGHGTETQVLSVKTGNLLTIGSRDFRFHPTTREMQIESGPSQFGRNRDAWGHWFGTQNSNPLWQYVIPDRYLQRNPYVPAPSPIRHVVGSGSPPVFPASPPEKRYHSYDQSGRFTSACGGMIYNDQWLFGQSHEAHGFTCEPFHNLVQHHVLSDAGPSYTSRRSPGEELHDFFASEDRWCRPVMARTGPDGALWVADMYRYMIEHPDWLTPEGRAELLPHYRLGEDKGRIYRVVRVDAPRQALPLLDSLSLKDLVKALDSPNDWQRDKAQQLLDRRERSAAVPQLVRLAHDGNHPEARVQALCLLQSWEAVSESTLVASLRDPHPRVRENAIKIAETFSNAEIIREVTRLKDDSDAKVRFQLALSCGQWIDTSAGEALAAIAQQDYQDPLVVAAIMSSAVPHQDVFARRVLSGDRQVLAAFREPLLRHSLTSKNPQAIAWMLQDALRGSFAEQCRQLADFVVAVQRLNLGLAQLKEELPNSQLADLIAAAEAVIAEARGQVESSAVTTEDPLPAAILLTRFVEDRHRAVQVLGQALTPQVDGQVQTEVIRHIAASAAENAPTVFGQAWDGLSPTLRSQVLDAWLSRVEWTRDLVTRIASGEVPANSLDLAQRTQLLQHRDTWVVEQANQLYRREFEPKQALLKYRESLELAGDIERGRAVYVTSCATCHRRGDLGADVGPNLATVIGHSPEKLLANILDPNADIQPGYQSFACLLNTGEVLTGVLSAESAHSLTLTQANGTSRTILRSEIEQLGGTGVSLMPEGFEQTITPTAMADLLAFLKSPIPK